MDATATAHAPVPQASVSHRLRVPIHASQQYDRPALWKILLTRSGKHGCVSKKRSDFFNIQTFLHRLYKQLHADFPIEHRLCDIPLPPAVIASLMTCGFSDTIGIRPAFKIGAATSTSDRFYFSVFHPGSFTYLMPLFVAMLTSSLSVSP